MCQGFRLPCPAAIMSSSFKPLQGLCRPRQASSVLVLEFGHRGECYEKWDLRGVTLALKAPVSFSVSSLELAPVGSAQPSTCPCWEPRWLLLKSEMPSPATMSYIFGPSPYMISEAWVPRNSTASSVPEPLTISVSNTCSSCFPASVG